MLSNIWQKVEARTITGRRRFIAKKGDGRQSSFPKLKLPESKRFLGGVGAMLLLIFAWAYSFLMPVAEVATVRRGTAISAVYGTVRIEPAFVVPVRAQNDGFIRLAESFSAGRGAIGKSVEKGQLLATIADEETSRELKQARADLQAASTARLFRCPLRNCLKPLKTIWTASKS